ncbi:uncharacterized protein N7511_001763 [Penicillium nucicola]|uniref:uncharacterized protein n=1 Tax=Penicillium nucicola TaxID=1850975 RepID=UPI002545A9A0|nr:uncharacterized protein N7511_011387 [Penicillium nucicola]XP_056978721.1 uncharacterized protein N7511_011226 [Penicillium nucicola]XP_056989921.1 uncharacterized protein N7511_001763 [Penicillium nucicola]KAJ5742368.1 hypothetical protein N7511_011387 [Penicillium nucicola]KAJ5742655.1 hypothetical protein N7511_011226 [Penicillium nucicola]KAJ5776752.1 hypothetical protein N7511_001763 [Penicillium nucicola]
MSFALASHDLPFIRSSREESESLVRLAGSSASIVKFAGSRVEYIQINPLEYSKEAALAFHFETSVLNNGPKIVTGRPTQTTVLSTDIACSVDLESTTTESDIQNSNPNLIVMRFQIAELGLREDMNDAILYGYVFSPAISFVC